jgi:hypothetical protein
MSEPKGPGGNCYHCTLQILAILFNLNLFLLPDGHVLTFLLALCIKRVALLCKKFNAGQEFLGVSVKEWLRSERVSR